jgi:hypothetical protein
MVAAARRTVRPAAAAAAPVSRPLRLSRDRTPTHGYSATREAAMAAFAKAGGGSEAFLILPAKQAKIDGL